MNEGIIILILSIVAAVLAGIICYQQFAFRKGIKAQLLQISQGLARAVDSDSEEKVMVFTDSRAMQELCAQINRLLDRRQRMLADYRRSEISSKKMLSNISHDIRTPLTVILGYLEIIRLNGGEQRELIDKVEARAKAVSDLVEQFFTLAKLEAGDMEIALSKTELCELCREVVLDFYEILSGKDYEVEVEIPEKTVYVQGNRDAIRRILNNLISNSLRYGSEGRYLGIFLHEDEKQVYIDVTDRGRGIEKDFAEHIFDRLFTMEDSRNRDIQGNGLGLTIARSLARQMGGDVTLVSRPWQKTSFTVALKRNF
jgi:Signal transduction histidine kinase